MLLHARSDGSRSEGFSHPKTDRGKGTDNQKSRLGEGLLPTRGVVAMIEERAFAHLDENPAYEVINYDDCRKHAEIGDDCYDDDYERYWDGTEFETEPVTEADAEELSALQRIRAELSPGEEQQAALFSHKAVNNGTTWYEKSSVRVCITFGHRTYERDYAI